MGPIKLNKINHSDDYEQNMFVYEIYFKKLYQALSEINITVLTSVGLYLRLFSSDVSHKHQARKVNIKHWKTAV